jgi:hypothetical protein
MWIHLTARDASNQVVYESGRYDAATGVLTHDARLALYEAKLGISPALAGVIGTGSGPSFHFALNDSLYKDNRIPPLGFTNSGFATFGGAPVDPDRPGSPRYADGQNWDLATYPLPSSTRQVVAELYYQTTSKEYVEFLRDENNTNTAGQTMYNLWSQNGRAAPVLMKADTVRIVPGAVEAPAAGREFALEIAPVPFRDQAILTLRLTRQEPVRVAVIDPQGRCVRRWDLPFATGEMRVTWDGRDNAGRPVGSGVYWILAAQGGETRIRRAVCLR